MTRAVERSVERLLPWWTRAYAALPPRVYLLNRKSGAGAVPDLILALAEEEADRWWLPVALSDGSDVDHPAGAESSW